MNGLLLRAGSRHLVRHPWQALLAVLGVGLGVAVVVGIDIAEDSARESFARASAAVSGSTTHHVVGPPHGFDERLYAWLRLEQRLRSAAPVVRARVLLAADGRAVDVLGLDPLAEYAVRSDWWPASGADSDTVRRLMAEPGTALASPALLARLGMSPPTTVTVVAAGRASELTVIDRLVPRDPVSAAALDATLVVDIATAQELLAMAGRLSRIDLVLDARQAEALAAVLPSEVRLETAAAGTRATLAMTDAFYTNLDALSLLALLVGLFLVYNAETFLVLQRHADVGMLWAIGASRRAIARVFAAEALLLGLIGTALGIALGRGLAALLLGQLTQTVNDLYFAVEPGSPVVRTPTLAKAGVLGVVGTLAAAAAPLAQALRTAPRRALDRMALETTAGRMAGVAARLGVGLLVAAAALLGTPTDGLVAGFAGLFALVLGAALLAPWAMAGITAAAEPLARRGGLVTRHVVRQLRASLSRTGVAAAALMLAVAATVAIGLMIDSFRRSVDDWLRHVLKADFYVTAAVEDPVAGALPRSLVQALAAVPQVRAVTTVRRTTVLMGGARVRLSAYELTPEARDGFVLLAGGPPATAWRTLEREDAVMVSEPLARRHGLRPGDRITLGTPRGERRFRVVAVYRDYATEAGAIAMARTRYDRYWDDDTVTGIGVYAHPGLDAERLRSALARIAPAAALRVRANDALRRASLAVFDRTFAITHTLRAMAAVIAFVGTLGALLALAFERRRELGVLKALGADRPMLFAMVVGEAGLIGIAAALLAVPVGVAMALVLIEVINQRAFGWSMALHLDPALIAGPLALGVVAALLAGLYPAARVARQPPAPVLRND